jgi:hypothetical protein
MFTMTRFLGVSLFAAAMSLWGAEAPPETPVLKGSTSRVVEERTVVETKKFYEAETPKPMGLRKTAIFVDNRAGEGFNDKVAVLEDLLAARLAGKGFSILSRDLVVNALKQYPAPGTAVPVSESPGQKLDRLLSDSTSALRLAQNLGADFILAPTITTYGEESRTFQGSGVASVNVIHTLRVGYRIAEAAQGGMVAGDTVAVSKTIRQTAGLQINNQDLINQLLDEAAGLLAASLVQKQGTLPNAAVQAGRVNIAVAATVADFARLPNAWLNDKNEVVLGDGSATAQALDVTVELNGVALGSAPGSFPVPPGLNKIRLSRVGFKDYERTINTFEGQKLVVAMQMSEAGYQRWKDMVAFMTRLENNRKLTDAEVKIMEGYAQQLRQSGFKVDTKEAPQLNIYKSLY